MKWFHAIGVCGHATSQVAVMFKQMGWFVTGSDLQYFPPSVDLLKENDIKMVEGYNYEHLTKDYWIEALKMKPAKWKCGDVPDVCLVIDLASPQNKELLFAKKRKIDARPYAQILGEYLVKPESIVIIGSAGKTTTTSLMVKLLQNLTLDPSYMIGAPVIDLGQSLNNTNSKWSVLEGDEYHNPLVSRGAKFLEYKPKYLVITKISWEHQDVFNTQESYVQEFAKAARIIPEDGFILAKYGDKNIDKALEGVKCKVVRYKLVNSLSDELKDPNLNLWKVVKAEGGINMIYDHNNDFIMDFKTSLMGDYNLENILACVALICNVPAHTLPQELIDNGTSNLQTIQRAIDNFKGPKKRLEILLKRGSLVIVEDFGVVPERAENSLKTLKENFPDFKITAIFEPNAGSRPADLALFNQLYDKSFKLADEVIIPDLSTANLDLAQSDDFVTRLNDLGFNTKYIPVMDLHTYLNSKVKQDKKTKRMFIFFSSYRLTSVAKEISEKLSK